MSDHDKHQDGHHHFVLPNKTGLTVLSLLLVFTVITVVAAQFNFGALNFPIAMFIASIKALMVVLFFMGLKYDDNENRIIFVSSFVFAIIFIVLTAMDLFTRGDIIVKGPALKAVTSTAEKVKKPWEPTPELSARGLALYKENQRCTICHGEAGDGNGPAGAALNPKPRNFKAADGWKNGRKPSQIYLTLQKGLGSMPSFTDLSSDDRWALVHYVSSLGPTPEADSLEDLKKVGFDPALGDYGVAGGEVKVQRKIPVDFALERYLNESR